MDTRERIKALIAERSTSATAVGKAAGLGDTTLTKYLNGHTRSISVENLDKVAEVLEVSLRHLMFGEPDADNVVSIWDRIPDRDKPKARAILEAFIGGNKSA